MSYLTIFIDQMSYSAKRRIDQKSYATNCRIGEMVFDELSCTRLHVFLVRSPWVECVLCQVISVLSGPIGWQVLDMFKTSNGRHRINIYGGCTLLMRWYAVCPVLVWFVRFSCVWHPVGILYGVR